MHAESTPATSRSPIPARLRPDEVAATYRRVAPVYDLWARLTEHRARARCLELAGVRDGESGNRPDRPHARPRSGQGGRASRDASPRPAGRMVLVNMAISDALPSRIWESLYRIDARLMGGCRGVSLARAVAAAGFVVEQEERVSQLGFPSEILRGRRSDPRTRPRPSREPASGA